MSVGYQVKQNLKSGNMENLNSLLKFWVWESGRKIDPATGVTPVAGLFLLGLGFEKIFKTQGILKIPFVFQVMLE